MMLRFCHKKVFAVLFFDSACGGMLQQHLAEATRINVAAWPQCLAWLAPLVAPALADAAPVRWGCLPHRSAARARQLRPPAALPYWGRPTQAAVLRPAAAAGRVCSRYCCLQPLLALLPAAAAAGSR